MAKILKIADKILTPSFCLNCKKETPEEPESLRWLCLGCRGRISTRWQKAPYKPEIDESYFVFEYQKDKLVQKLIRALKYSFVKEISETFGIYLESERMNFKKMSADNRIDFIAPVPLHKKRFKEREFNQSELIAQKIAGIIEKPILENAVERKFYRRPQAQVKNRNDREKNIKNIFSVVSVKKFFGKNILLIDDVATTGATLKECARILKNSGATKVVSFTLAQD